MIPWANWRKIIIGWIHSDFVGGIADAVFGEKLVLVIEGEKHYWMSIYSWTSIKSQKKFFYITNSLRQKTENKKKRNVREHLNSLD
jgi:hypothetical protein